MQSNLLSIPKVGEIWLCERQAPENIILKVLRYYPEAVMKLGKHSNYPLHIAARQCLSHIVLIALVKQFPEALDEVNDNNCTPRSFHQKSERSRSVLMRPTACWIETVEREEYESKRIEEIEGLKARIDKLKESLAKSNAEEKKVISKISLLEPMLVHQASNMASLAINEREVLLKKKQLYDTLGNMNNRMTKLQNSIDNKLDNNRVVISKELASKREFFESVKQEYEKVMSVCSEVRDEIDLLKQVLLGDDT